MGISVERDREGVITKLVINDEVIEPVDEGIYYVPKGLLKNIEFKEMPEDTIFKICEKIDEDGTIHIDGTTFEISKSDDKASINFEDMGRRKYWDGNVGFNYFMETKRDIIQAREKEVGDIGLVDYQDDGDYIFLRFSTDVEPQTFEGIIQTAEQLITEIDGTVELTLGSSFKKLSDVKSEEDFTLTIIIPILRRLGFSNIRYNHGNKEFGKDVIFTRKTEFDGYEYWGAQIKCGDISGEANSEVDEIIAQADDAFKVSFYDLYTKRREKIAKLLIIISGNFTENAIEKIWEKIKNNNVGSQSKPAAY